jgi:hypothetical protein
MTGLVKAKQYDWKDSNLALFGSDTEKNVSKFEIERAVKSDFLLVAILRLNLISEVSQ